MYAVAWRHNANSPWNLNREPVPSEQAAREEINKIGKYDMAKREYRIIPLGDADMWSDPFAEQAARLDGEQDDNRPYIIMYRHRNGELRYRSKDHRGGRHTRFKQYAKTFCGVLTLEEAIAPDEWKEYI